jgi:hypothetical protein
MSDPEGCDHNKALVSHSHSPATNDLFTIRALRYKIIHRCEHGGFMKSSASAGAVSGCIVWALVFAALGTCIFPVVMAVGGFTSSTSIAIQTTGNIICPEGTTPESYSYATTSTDEYGNSHPATAYELHCVNATGEVVKEDPVGFAFLWMGILAGIGLVVAVILAFAIAAPAGVLIARLLNRNRKGNQESAYTPPA